MSQRSPNTNPDTLQIEDLVQLPQTYFPGILRLRDGDPTDYLRASLAPHYKPKRLTRVDTTGDASNHDAFGVHRNSFTAATSVEHAGDRRVEIIHRLFQPPMISPSVVAASHTAADAASAPASTTASPAVGASAPTEGGASLTHQHNHLHHEPAARAPLAARITVQHTHPANQASQSQREPNILGGVDKKKILIIFTGGTIGMDKDAEGVLKPSKGFLQRTMANFVEMQHPDVPAYDILEWETPLDSSDFSPECWSALAAQIYENYYKYDGFVILHGTDTMAYTASALSYMLENLGKTVVLTGAMIPLVEPVSDAKRNLLVSMMVASHLNIPEVLLFFNAHLMRGNRSKKTDPWRLVAIESPNLEPLATMGVGIHVRPKLFLPHPARVFQVHLNLYSDIIVISLAPAFCYRALRAVATSWRNATDGNGNPREPPAIVLMLYGSGNAPTKGSEFKESIKLCLEENCPVVVLSQCIRGSVDLTAYEGGKELSRMGVIDGKDMTVEATVAKLAYLMGRGLRGAKLKIAMETNLRGELTTISSVSYTGYVAGQNGFLSKL